MLRPKAEKDLFAGIAYLALAAAFLWFGQSYRFGTAAQMGPGFFPRVLAAILAVIGIIAVGRAWFASGERVGRLQWRPLILVTLAAAGFGILVGRGGLVVALVWVSLVSAAASRESTYDLKGLGVLVALILFCVLIFVKGLGVPMPIFGTWFDGVVPPSWQR